MTKILILANYDVGLYKFRKELIEELLKKYEVYISLPKGKYTDELEEMGCTFVETKLERRGTNLFSDFKLLSFYRNIIKKIKPKVILTYTIKPNIYGGIAAKINRVPYITNITGLGTALENETPLKNILIRMYRFALSNVEKVFFQNEKNMALFYKNSIAIGKYDSLPGSGVNLNYFHPIKYPVGDEINFVFISRIMKDKGIDHFIEAAKSIKSKYTNVNFHICGFSEEDYEHTIESLHNNGIIIYHGMVDDIREVFKNMHCIIHPSYHEGMSNVLLEAAASARPIIASDIPGCRETFDNNISGFSFPKSDTKELIKVVEKFLGLSNEQRKHMGLKGRQKMENEFDRQIVVNKYISEINRIMDGDQSE